LTSSRGIAYGGFRRRAYVGPNRSLLTVSKNKHLSVSQGAWRFGKRSILADM